MSLSPSTVPTWESGRLARLPAPPRAPVGERWIAAALLSLAAIVLGLFVAVLVQDVQRGAIQRQEIQVRALAQASCEAARPTGSHGSCSDAVADADRIMAGDPTAAGRPRANGVSTTLGAAQ